MNRAGRVCLAALLACGAATVSVQAAFAERAAVVLGGELRRQEEQPLAKAAADTVRAAGWTVIDAGLTPEAASELIGCIARDISDDEGCLSDLFQRTRVDRAVVVGLRSKLDGGKPARELRGWVFRQSGKGLQFATQFCHEPCSREQMEVRTRDFVAKLVQGARARARPSTLYIRSNPPRAEIRLDQALVGVTDMDFSVYPGTHVVSLSKKGFERAIREVTVDDGETVTLDVTLQPHAGTTKPETSTDKPARSSASPRPTSPRPVAKPRSRWVAWTVLGAGGAALVGAGALVLLDQDERSQGGVRQQDVRQTAWYGVGLGAAGAAAVGVGLVLLFRPAAETTPAPAIALDHQAAWLGVRGAF